MEISVSVFRKVFKKIEKNTFCEEIAYFLILVF